MNVPTCCSHGIAGSAPARVRLTPRGCRRCRNAGGCCPEADAVALAKGQPCACIPPSVPRTTSACPHPRPRRRQLRRLRPRFPGPLRLPRRCRWRQHCQRRSCRLPPCRHRCRPHCFRRNPDVQRTRRMTSRLRRSLRTRTRHRRGPELRRPGGSGANLDWREPGHSSRSDGAMVRSPASNGGSGPCCSLPVFPLRRPPWGQGITNGGTGPGLLQLLAAKPALATAAYADFRRDLRGWPARPNPEAIRVSTVIPVAEPIRSGHERVASGLGVRWPLYEALGCVRAVGGGSVRVGPA